MTSVTKTYERPTFMSSETKYDYLCKLLIVGDSVCLSLSLSLFFGLCVILHFVVIVVQSVGKSCLLLRYCDDAFSESFITTIGIDFKVRTVIVNGKKVRLQIWDTAGQERFQTILPAYYRGAHGIALVFDVTDERSFLNVSNWIKSIEQHAKDNVQTILVANKCDMISERVVSKEQAHALSKEYNSPLIETSAKTNYNVTLAFETLIAKVVPSRDDSAVPVSLQLQTTNTPSNTCLIAACQK
jgi:Ras-related protein Rab-8A